MDDMFSCRKIGIVRSCFKQKFGIPRQPGLAAGATAVLDIEPPFGAPECFRGIERFSHLWVLFYFHATALQGWNSTVRPPRLGGDKRVGVFATRSNFRPNPFGLSAVKFLGITFKRGHALIEVENHDLLDGSPILDVKPYIRFADSMPDAVSFDPPETKLEVDILPEVRLILETYSDVDIAVFENLMIQLVSTDPRPAYLAGKPDADTYAVTVGDIEFRFRMEMPGVAVIYTIYRLPPLS